MDLNFTAFGAHSSGDSVDDCIKLCCSMSTGFAATCLGFGNNNPSSNPNSNDPRSSVYVTVLLPYFTAKPSSETKSPNHIQRLLNTGTPVFTVSVPSLLDYLAFPVSAAQRTAIAEMSDEELQDRLRHYLFLAANSPLQHAKRIAPWENLCGFR
jgi:hypothetical protein